MERNLIVKTREKTVSDVFHSARKLFEEKKFYFPVPLERFKNYEWFSEDCRREAAENMACALIACKGNMPAQAERRFGRGLQMWDTDRVEKRVSQVKRFNKKAKLFASSGNTDFPIKVKGRDKTWTGQLISEQHELTRHDQLIPKHDMRRLNMMWNEGIHFDDGYALFWPHEPNRAPKKLILSQQIGSLRDDAVKLADMVRSTYNAGRDSVSSFSRAVSNPVAQLEDPVLTGVIAGSLMEPRYFFIELGRWIKSD
jgi:hypothetical protein